MSIRRLPPEISGKIAAGEVIERPASVVRELLDNALDAGARRVDVAVERGGKALIDVTDDGCGIPPDEVAMAVERHSTSKLTTVDDLARIQTLGFRGEALASIAAVAELRLRSVTGEGRPGREVLARDERLIEERPVGGARGTRATVRGLFQSIPARLEFLKAERTELGHIIAAVTPRRPRPSARSPSRCTMAPASVSALPGTVSSATPCTPSTAPPLSTT